MEAENPKKESNEVIKAKGTCKQFIKQQGLTLEQCMLTGPDGNLVFKLNYSLPNNKEKTLIHFSVIPAKSKEVQDKMLVWSYIAALENIPVQSRLEFYKEVLELNHGSDTAWAGLSKDNKITVKSERMIKGIDIDELTDMIKMTAKLAQELRGKICVVHGVKTIIEEDAPEISRPGSNETQPAAYALLLGKLQKKVMETASSCKSFLFNRDYKQCSKIYFKDAYELLEIIKKGGSGDSVIETIKEDLERAIADLPYFPDNQKKYEMLHEVFQKILNAR